MIAKSENGFVSMLTAILLSLLLLAITVSLVELQAITLRKSDDSEQSQRAYYSAESGVEDAIAKIRSGVLTTVGQDCSNPAASQKLALSAGLGKIGWSCQSVTFSGSPSDTLRQPDSAITIDPGENLTNASIRSMTIRWDTSGQTNPAYFAPGSLTGGTAGYGLHAMPLELSIVTYPQSLIGFKLSSILRQNIFILPRDSSSSSVADTSYSARGTCTLASHAAGNGGCGLDTGKPARANCTVAGTKDPSNNSNATYSCSINIDNLPENNPLSLPLNLNPNAAYKLFRLNSRFVSDSGGSGNYVVNFYDSPTPDPAHLLSISDSTATIDVTGEAGDVFRRVIYKLPVGNVASPILNDALFSEVGLCQDYSIVNGTSTGSDSGSCNAGGH